MNQKLQAVKGMNDILPPESARWEWLEEVVRGLMARYGYRNLRTPIVEPTALFVRGLGEVTDIVEKEMYSFEDKMNGEHLTLRPENTAGVVRAAIEHSLLYAGPARLYYSGPMFRHERPQRGRQRQFHQIGVEALGFPGPELDVETIVLAQQLWEELGLRDIRLEINSLGQASERQAHRSALVGYLEKHQDQLDDTARRRLHSNPLRVLDSKTPPMQALLNEAPRTLDYLGDESRQHFERVCRLLDSCGVAYQVNPRLVRGMDYYNRTVFEFITDQLGAQSTICGGGRYDYLFEQMGGAASHAVGWALGVERVLDLMQEQQIPPPATSLHAYAIIPNAEALTVAYPLLSELRSAGLSVQMHAASAQGWASMKAQFKKADASGARYALIFGADELAAGLVSVKSLRDGQGEQRQQPLADAAALTALLLKS